jgi:hypothetical protein
MSQKGKHDAGQPASSRIGAHVGDQDLPAVATPGPCGWPGPRRAVGRPTDRVLDRKACPLVDDHKPRPRGRASSGPAGQPFAHGIEKSDPSFRVGIRPSPILHKVVRSRPRPSRRRVSPDDLQRDQRQDRAAAEGTRANARPRSRPRGPAGEHGALPRIVSAVSRIESMVFPTPDSTRSGGRESPVSFERMVSASTWASCPLLGRAFSVSVAPAIESRVSGTAVARRGGARPVRKSRVGGLGVLEGRHRAFERFRTSWVCRSAGSFQETQVLESGSAQSIGEARRVEPPRSSVEGVTCSHGASGSAGLSTESSSGVRGRGPLRRHVSWCTEMAQFWAPVGGN